MQHIATNPSVKDDIFEKKCGIEQTSSQPTIWYCTAKRLLLHGNLCEAFSLIYRAKFMQYTPPFNASHKNVESNFAFNFGLFSECWLLVFSFRAWRRQKNAAFDTLLVLRCWAPQTPILIGLQLSKHSSKFNHLSMGPPLKMACFLSPNPTRPSHPESLLFCHHTFQGPCKNWQDHRVMQAS